MRLLALLLLVVPQEPCTTVSGGTDYDGDAYVREHETSVACINAGDFIMTDGRRYYAVAGSYTWLAAADVLGYDDCADASASGHDRYRNVAGGADADHDGHIQGASASVACVGDAVTLSGRTYYRDYIGGDLHQWLDAASTVGFSDPNDRDATVPRGPAGRAVLRGRCGHERQ